MLGGLISGGLGLVGGALGGIFGSKKKRQANRMLEEQKAENEAWYNRRINEDMTQRADAQRLLEMTRKGIEERNKRAQGVSAVMGGDDAAVAAAQERNNAAIGETMSAINAQGEARKDKIESQYQERQAALNGQQYNQKLQDAKDTAEAWGNFSSQVGGILGNFF